MGKILVIIALLSLGVLLAFYLSTYHPGDIEEEAVTCDPALPTSLLSAGANIKILNWNVQYMAGKNNIFFYDKSDGSGPDVRPSAADITTTFDRVVKVIHDEDPDIILLQELDDGARRTDYQDQLRTLLEKLARAYPCHTSTYYWRAAFVPHPKIMGSVGMRLGIISKYRITRATRHQLPLMPNNFFVRHLQLKRAVLEAVLPMGDGRDLAVMTTHLDAFAQGSDTMAWQVTAIDRLLTARTDRGIPWIIGGDFNLLPPIGNPRARLSPLDQTLYNAATEITPLFKHHTVLPTRDDLEKTPAKNFTHSPNGGEGPDRTIDYFFVSPHVTPQNFHVRSADTQDISDHLPLVMEVSL